MAAVVAGKASLATLYARWAKKTGAPGNDRTDDSPTENARASGAANASLLRALVTDCLRWHFRLQWQLAALLDKPLPAKDAELGALLRIGLLQLQFMQVPTHAAVDETVAAADALHRRHARGLVNAVLRRYLREREQLDARMAEDDEAHLSHPAWFIDALRAEHGPAAEAVFAANNAHPPMWLRVNTQRTTVAAFMARLADAGLNGRGDAELPAAVKLDSPVASFALPGFADGDVSIQDRAAQLAVEFLDAAPGQRVLDACAAPGGKTAALLEQCPTLAEVVAIDHEPARVATLERYLARLQLGATVLCADAAEPQSWWNGQPFERILLDAPCSATGVIRRHPDIKLRRDPQTVAEAVAMQARLLEALWPLLAEDGVLVYVTCSVLKCENEQQIDRFVAATPSARLCRARQFLPGEADGDGFYYACVKKRD